MKVGVLLDTSYLISLVDIKRINHPTAKKFYQHMIEQQVNMYLSAIVAAEFSIGEPISNLPLGNFLTIPFNLPDAIESARVWNALGARDAGDSRPVIRDDVKLIAQAEKNSIPFILTEDASTLFKYCRRLQQAGHIKLRAVKLADGFSDSLLRLDGQAGFLGWDSDPEQNR